MDICDPEVGAGALPALRNFVFWRFLGHETGKRVWSCSSQRWGHSIGTALEASDFLPQGKVFQPRPALSSTVSPRVVFPAAMHRGHQESHKTNHNREASGTVPRIEAGGVDLGFSSLGCN